jgi:nucleoside-diphosphate-sugar epimerase
VVNVVTGGEGHIGCNLVRQLLADGRAVRVVDRREPTALVADLYAFFADADD